MYRKPYEKDNIPLPTNDPHTTDCGIWLLCAVSQSHHAHHLTPEGLVSEAQLRAKPTTITLKAIDTPVSHVALPRQILPVSEVIRRITGLEEETANRYVIRSNALSQIACI